MSRVRVGALVLTLLVSGCASTAAVYRHPVTSDVQTCSNEMGLFWWSGPLAYGACKDALEAKVYRRE